MHIILQEKFYRFTQSSVCGFLLVSHLSKQIQVTMSTINCYLTFRSLLTCDAGIRIFLKEVSGESALGLGLGTIT